MSKPTKIEKAKQKNKLTFAESKELKHLPAQISKLETELASLHQAMNKPDFYSDKLAADKRLRDAQDVQSQLDEAYSRWETLEQMSVD